MRWSSVAIATLIAGCAHIEVDPASIAVVAYPELSTCTAAGTDIPVKVSVRNDSSGKLTLGANGEQGPPYSLNWVYYRVLSNRTGTEAIDLEHGPGGHGWLSTTKVTLGPGDSADFMANVYELVPASAQFSWRIELQDVAGNSFLSQPFGLCLPGSTPNNSSKPTPLRGAA